MKFSEIKHKIKNLGSFKSLPEIKKAKLRIVKNIKSGDYWLIEEEFLKPVIKSPRECKSIMIKPKDLKYKVFMCHKSRKELERTKALEYIEWGESRKFHERPTCKWRKYWWDLGNIDYGIVYPKTHSPAWAVFLNENFYYIDAFLYGIKSTKYKPLWYFMNSTLALFQTEFYGYSLVGGGGSFITVEDLEKILVLPNENLVPSVSNLIKRKYLPIFTELGFDPKGKPIREQQPNPLPDRKALDDIVFDALELTEDERKEVYWVVAELVQNRLQKAKSV